MLKNLINNPVSMVSASLLTLACTTGCVSQPLENNQGTIPANTQLALSPNGNRLVVSWYDPSMKLHAKLVELNGATVASVRDLALPPATFTTAFANNNTALLVTTNVKGVSDFIKVDVDTGNQTLIYKSAYVLRFPLEVSNGNYVFLEGEAADQHYAANRLSRWQRYQQGKKTLLHDRPFGSASPLDIIGESLFDFTPARTFLAIYGKVPEALSSLIDNSTWNITCADRTQVTCLHENLYLEAGRYLGTKSIFNGQHRCDIAGKWLDTRQVKISRDGGTVVFHVAVQELNGPRAIYVVKNSNLNCSTHVISIKGE